MLTVLVIWFALAVMVGVAAGTRGRSGFGWFLLAVFLSPLIAGLFLLLFPSRAAFEAPYIHEGIPFQMVGKKVDAMIDGGIVRFANLEQFKFAIEERKRSRTERVENASN